MELLACSPIALGTEVTGFRETLLTWVTPGSKCRVGRRKQIITEPDVYIHFLCKQNNPKSFVQVITLRSARSLRQRRRGAQVEGGSYRGSAINLSLIKS